MGHNSNDTKPDISQLCISTSSGGQYMGMPSMARYPNYPGSQHGGPGMQAGVYFDMGMMGMSHSPAPGSHTMPSPSMHSQSSMSPAHMLPSPGSTIASPTSTMGPPFHQGHAMGASAHFQTTKHTCAICGDRASGKHYGVYRQVDNFVL